jgi:hypothetical protein
VQLQAQGVREREREREWLWELPLLRERAQLPILVLAPEMQRPSPFAATQRALALLGHAKLPALPLLGPPRARAAPTEQTTEDSPAA